MRSMWKGSIAFGLVTVPVKLYKATEEKTPSFHQLHGACSARIKLNKVCTSCGKEVNAEQIVRGYEYDKDSFVVISDAEIDRGAPQSHAIEITQFISVDEIDPTQFASAYYLGPDLVGAKAYALLTEAMRRTERVAIATITMRQRERVVLLRLSGQVLVLHVLFWPDEIRAPAVDYIGEPVELRRQEIDMACSLVQSLASTFEPDALRDRYRERLEAVIDAKIAGVEPELEPVDTPAVLDLMQALEASIKRSSEIASARQAAQR